MNNSNDFVKEVNDVDANLNAEGYPSLPPYQEPVNQNPADLPSKNEIDLQTHPLDVEVGFQSGNPKAGYNMNPSQPFVRPDANNFQNQNTGINNNPVISNNPNQNIAVNPNTNFNPAIVQQGQVIGIVEKEEVYIGTPFPKWLAWVCAFVNFFLPGIGTMLGAIGMNDHGTKMSYVCTGCCQLVTTVCLVGWFFAQCTSCVFIAASFSDEPFESFVAGKRKSNSKTLMYYTLPKGNNTQKPQANQGNTAQGYANPNQGYTNQGYSNQGYSNQGYSNQGYSNQGYSNQGYAAQGNIQVEMSEKPTKQ